MDIRTPGAVAGRVRPEAVRRALANLIENALSHGRPPVRIEITWAGDMVEIAVRDNGPGAPEESLDLMKTPFRRGLNSGRVAGSGLGLAIVDRIATMHGGALHLRNHPEGGLEARLTLPGPEVRKALAGEEKSLEHL
jgi:two-component system osmolarity sensor histidine kinase EnvZ